ncbi:MAG: AraC family transcriptional regulator [Labilibaculum sp.]|nr:AraC family transcriptional regulator [Labilibaculum sp.]
MIHNNSPFIYSEKTKYSIDNQLSVIEANSNSFEINVLAKIEETISIICRKGELRYNINALEYIAKAPCMIIMMVKHFVEINAVSDDFDGTIVLMTNEFTENLGIEDRVSPFLAVFNNSYISLKEIELNSLVEFCSIIKKISRNNENPLIIESAKHLIKAYYYGLGYALFFNDNNENKSQNKLLTNDFLNIVQKDYHHQRKVKYYSDILHLTPKYLSKVIKQRTGFSASKWINKFVLMEAKTLLKSTDLTIQQITYKLNFPSQSFFGKCFKKNTGMSPSEYRAKRIN